MHPFPIRTVTAGVNLSEPPDPAPVEAALEFLRRAGKVLGEAGWEIQTRRLATQPWVDLSEGAAPRTIERIRELDRAVAAEGVLLAIGPVDAHGVSPAAAAAWAVDLITSTGSTSFSLDVAAPARGVDREAAAAAGAIMAALAEATNQGTGNFRFAAAARIPDGTPFFPVARHSGPPAFALGFESAGLVADAFGGGDPGEAVLRLRSAMEDALVEIGPLAHQLAADTGHRFLGIDASPAPGLTRSIAAGIETLTGQPFGSGATLAACSAITEALHGLALQTCGYSGLMLPVLEDPVLARRASESRFSVRELLLYSAVCGTGLDVVPLPGNTPAALLADLVTDMAALAVKLGKPLSARLFPLPGLRAGETASFDDPLLTDCAVMALD